MPGDDTLDLFPPDEPGRERGGSSRSAPRRDEPKAPLADRMRPRNLDEIVGQGDLVAQGAPLRSLVESGSLPSVILWGPPGSGKTTLAWILGDMQEARLAPLSAVTSGVPEIRKAVEAARRTRLRTILFIDEIHRFNKAQQDALLPHVESGEITLIGATTENPSFEVNGALLSRSRVVVLKPLEASDLVRIVRRDDARVVVGRTLSGRGAWLCAGSLACLQQARRRNAFGRALRGSVSETALDTLTAELASSKAST